MNQGRTTTPARRPDRNQVDRAAELLRQVRPALLSVLGGNQRTCVFCTRVACDALTRLGIRAEPLPVHLTVYNPAMRARMVGPRPGDSLYELGGSEGACYYIGSDIPQGPNVIFQPISGRAWFGHLICLIERRLILDLTLDQVSRPQYGIRLPAALIEPPADDLAEFLSETGKTLAGEACGCLIVYRNSGDQAFRDGADWSRTHARKTAVALSDGIAAALKRPAETIQWRTSPLAEAIPG